MQRLHIITGAAGFLGSTIIRQLNEKGERDVRALSLPGEDRTALQGLTCDIIDADVTDCASLGAAFAGAERFESVRIIHCAGVIDIRSKPNPNVERVNVGGTRNVVEETCALASRTNAAVRLAYIGSVHAIPSPEGNAAIHESEDFDPDHVAGQYAKSKAAASRLVMEAAREGLDALVVEPSGIIGPENHSPENMKRLILLTAQGRMRIAVHGGYNFVDVRDVAAGTIAAAARGRQGRSYILSGHSIPILELMNEVCDLCGLKPVRAVLPPWLARAVAPICELYYNVRKQVPLFTRYAIDTLQTDSNFDYARAKAELGYAPRPLRDTLADTVAWLRAQPDWNRR